MDTQKSGMDNGDHCWIPSAEETRPTRPSTTRDSSEPRAAMSVGMTSTGEVLVQNFGVLTRLSRTKNTITHQLPHANATSIEYRTVARRSSRLDNIYRRICCQNNHGKTNTTVCIIAVGAA